MPRFKGKRAQRKAKRKRREEDLYYYGAPEERGGVKLGSEGEEEEYAGVSSKQARRITEQEMDEQDQRLAALKKRDEARNQVHETEEDAYRPRRNRYDRLLSFLKKKEHTQQDIQSVKDTELLGDMEDDLGEEGYALAGEHPSSQEEEEEMEEEERRENLQAISMSESEEDEEEEEEDEDEDEVEDDERASLEDVDEETAAGLLLGRDAVPNQEEEEEDQMQFLDMNSEEAEESNQDPYHAHLRGHTMELSEKEREMIKHSRKKFVAVSSLSDTNLGQVSYAPFPLSAGKNQKKKETPSLLNLDHVNPVTNLQQAQVRTRLWKRWHTLPKEKEADTVLDQASSSQAKKNDFASLEQSVMFGVLNQYADVLCTTQSLQNSAEIRKVYILHALNHILKGRDTVLRNTLKMKQAQEKEERSRKKKSSQKNQEKKSKRTLLSLEDEEDENPGYQDQGFTRPKVLLVVPFRNIAFRLVELLFQLAPKVQAERVANKKRFYEEFGPSPDLSLAEDKKEGRGNYAKPYDWQHLFAGNVDDCFTLGIAFSRKTIKLYSAFYMSDMIIASPLGLRRLLATRLSEKKARKSNIGDYDYLSSLEVVVVDRMDVAHMQNWEHMEIILEHLNVMPRDPPASTDWSRIRPWYLDNQARFYRQLVLCSALNTPEIQQTMSRYCTSHAGLFRFRPTTVHGTITSVVRRVKQVFQRIDCDSPLEMADRRFNYFAEYVLPRLMQSTQERTIIFIPSYFDFVRVRNLFLRHERNKDLTYCVLSEYSSMREVARSRTHFFHGDRDFMLVTERFHFYRRYRLRGVHNFVFYGLPMYAHFYPEFINTLPEADTSVFVMYTKFDAMLIHGVLGRKRGRKLLKSDRDTHLFC